MCNLAAPSFVPTGTEEMIMRKPSVETLGYSLPPLPGRRARRRAKSKEMSVVHASGWDRHLSMKNLAYKVSTLPLESPNESTSTPNSFNMETNKFDMGCLSSDRYWPG